ncbi:hypothetical protein MACH24_18700 [Erythrobacter sp. Dej080120_24]|jgi:hypothetical protein|uniref:hypothetical protein n=1 Tax=unclassified Erythrobacter TaxID=2633097 RepID=UPI0026B52F98|nr:hypothetical protein MACH24_18700 [Erythrobacter sp. Dej080120_24]
MAPIALLAVPVLMLVADGGLSSDLQKQYDRLSVAYSMADTCRQHGWDVDMAGLEEWKVAAVDRAVEGGMDRAEAQERLDTRIQREYDDVRETFEEAARMAQSRDHVTRFNRRMKRDCERIGKDEMTGGYFYPPE